MTRPMATGFDDAFLDSIAQELADSIPEDMRLPDPPAPTPTIDELRSMTVVDIPTAGRVLGIGRDAAYALARRGTIPVLALGRRKVVPVPRLLALLGAEA